MKILPLISTLMLAVLLGFASVVSAQTVGTMPVLFNASGQAVNSSGGTLPAGTYYLLQGGMDPVTYYGDGTYFDPATDTFGGSIYNSTGRAGTYTIPNTNTTAVGTGAYVGVPNTGSGGNATGAWMALILSALVGVSGVVYTTRSRHAV